MGRLATISGAVLDDVTRKPVEGRQVTIVQETLAGWNRIPFPGFPVVTDVTGRFVRKGLPPGKYVVRSTPKPLRILQEFSEKDSSFIEEDYEQATFPGGGEDNMASPIDLPSGASMDLGKLILKKLSYHSAVVAFPPSTCEAGETVQLEEITYVGAIRWTTGIGSVSCGKNFLIQGFRPGEHTLQAWIPRPGGSILRACTLITIRNDDRNPRVTLAPAPSVNIEGTIFAEHDVSMPPVEKIRVQLRPFDTRRLKEQETTPDASGKFRFADVQAAEVSLQISGLSKPFYVRSIRDNGAMLNGDTAPIPLSLDPNAAAHSLEILIDDKPAALFGSVTRNDQRVEEPYVVLLRWPRAGSPIAISGDAGGQFQFAGLIPGEYRALAVSAADRESIHDPEVLDRALTKAQKVELAPNAVQRITLEVTDLKP
jgi:hypothetical protein